MPGVPASPSFSRCILLLIHPISVPMLLPSSSDIALSPISSPPPTTLAPSQPRVELHKRNEVCGVLNDYPNANAPVCSDTASLCTFSSGRQGCCDDSENCTFYTSCNGGLAESCTDPGCLQCPSASAYCTQYEFDDGGNNVYKGFGCGPFSLTEPAIYGSLGTQRLIATVTDSGASSAPRSATATSQIASATGTADSEQEGGGGRGLSTGTIGGAAAGGAVALIVLIAILLFCCRKRRRRTNETGPRSGMPQLSQSRNRPAGRTSFES